MADPVQCQIRDPGIWGYLSTDGKVHDHPQPTTMTPTAVTAAVQRALNAIVNG